MYSARIRTLVAQQWAGLIALFLVIAGGTALAATLPANSVKSKTVKDNSLKSKDLRDGKAVGGADIIAEQVQLRVGESCPEGEAIRVINVQGGVICEVDDQDTSGGPPSGPAGGDLTGSYPNPTLADGAVTGGPGGEVADGTLTGADIDEAGLDSSVLQSRISGGCAAGSAVASVSQGGGVACNTFPTSLPPSGGAGGDLTGTYPNPTLAPNASLSDTLVHTAVVHTPASTVETDSLTCPGSHPDVTGGGYEMHVGWESFAQVFDTRPLGGGNGWAVRMRNSGNALALPYTIWAICVQ